MRETRKEGSARFVLHHFYQRFGDWMVFLKKKYIDKSGKEMTKEIELDYWLAKTAVFRGHFH